MMKNVENLTIASFSYGSEFILFWEFYNNESCKKVKLIGRKQREVASLLLL